MFRMSSRSAAPIACAIAAIITSAAGRAEGLSCAVPGFDVPYHEAVQVPTNTRVWCAKDALNPLSRIRLRDSDGNDVSGTQTQISAPGYDIVVLHPDAELAPNSQYTVDCPPRFDLQPSTTFTTGSGPRTTPPAVPNVSNVETAVHPDGGWGASHFALFVQASAADTIVVVDVASGSATLDPDAPSGGVADALYLYNASDIGVGNGPCGGSWPGAKLGASTTVALGAFDLTGAFSGWSEPVTVTLPNEYPPSEDDTAEPVGGSEIPLDDDGSSDQGDVGETDSDGDGPSEATDVNATSAIDDTDDVSAANAANSDPVRPSPMGRSGCALGLGESSRGVSAGLLLALAGLVARRQRASHGKK
jgi:hypothetical protein